jgi:carbonic anhydrase
VNTGHTLEVACGVASKVAAVAHQGSTNLISGGPLDRDTFELLQFHFHTPSEHSLGGLRHAAELHLVHKSTTNPNHLVVVALLFQRHPDHKSQLLDEVLTGYANLPNASNPGSNITWHLNLASDLKLLRKEPYLYAYEGSLTTPPCSENVTWLVLSKPLNALAQQLTALHTIMGSNARPTQLSNNRKVKLFNLIHKHHKNEIIVKPDELRVAAAAVVHPQRSSFAYILCLIFGGFLVTVLMFRACFNQTPSVPTIDLAALTAPTPKTRISTNVRYQRSYGSTNFY